MGEMMDTAGVCNGLSIFEMIDAALEDCLERPRVERRRMGLRIQIFLENGGVASEREIKWFDLDDFVDAVRTEAEDPVSTGHASGTPEEPTKRKKRLPKPA